MTKATEMTVNEKNEVMNADVPDYIKQGQGRGNENVGADDIQLPRIEVLQAISPQINKRNAEYIDGAEAGMFFNTLTGDLLGESVRVTPINFVTRFLVWVDRQKDSNGGLRGVFDTEQEANQFLSTQEDAAKLEVVRTAEHLVMFDDGTTAIVSMSKSKQRASRKWNSLIRLNGGDRFSRSYELSSTEEKSAKGDYIGIDIKNSGYPSKEVYFACEELYTSLQSAPAPRANYDADIGKEEAPYYDADIGKEEAPY